MNEFITIGWTKDEIAKKIANEFGKDLTIVNKIGNYALKYN